MQNEIYVHLKEHFYWLTILGDLFFMDLTEFYDCIQHCVGEQPSLQII